MKITVGREGWVRRESKGVWKGWMTESRVKKLEERVYDESGIEEERCVKESVDQRGRDGDGYRVRELR